MEERFEELKKNYSLNKLDRLMKEVPVEQMKNELYISPKLIRNILLSRYDNEDAHTANRMIADALIGLDDCMEIADEGTKEYLKSAKWCVNMFHFYLRLMQEESQSPKA